MAKRNSLGKLATSVIKEFKGSLSSIEPTCTHIYVDSLASEDVILAVHAYFMPERTDATVHVSKLSDGVSLVSNRTSQRNNGSAIPDIAVIIPTPTSACEDALVMLASHAIPCAVVVESAVEAPKIADTLFDTGLITVIAGTTEEALFDRLSTWIATTVDKAVSFAAAYPSCRESVVKQITSACAKENAAIGAVALVPGSDMPLMTARQIRLALDITSAYNIDMSIETIAELLGVVGAGFGYRTVARTVAGAVPGFGWALKAGMGYAGTRTTARVIHAYARKLAEKRDGVAGDSTKTGTSSVSTGASATSDTNSQSNTVETSTTQSLAKR
jgi:hypothetical protein